MIMHPVATAVFNNVVVRIMFSINKDLILKPRAQNLPLRTLGKGVGQHCCVNPLQSVAGDLSNCEELAVSGQI